MGDKAAYYCIDTALKEDGEWTVIEVNDGCLAGLSGIDPYEHYSALQHAVSV